MLKTIFTLLLILVYGLRFYDLFSPNKICDFLSLYQGAWALQQGDNPYQIFASFPNLPTNFNPPIVLLMLQPLSLLSPHNALIIWTFLSLLLGTLGAGIAFHYAFEENFIKKNQIYLYGLYWSSFAVLMNTSLGQLGGLLLCLIMGGYHFYKKQKNLLAGILWGLITAIKFFPALLLFYTLIQKRYRVILWSLLSFLFFSTLPFLLYHTTPYLQYIAVFKETHWYGANWNASLYGLLFRYFIQDNHAHFFWLYSIYATLFLITIGFYVQELIKNEKETNDQRSFCLTLSIMLFLSPLGWLYYLPLLTLPLCLTYRAAITELQHPLQAPLLWCICVFLLNFPTTFFNLKNNHTQLNALSIQSAYFYGLILIIYLTLKLPNTLPTIHPHTTSIIRPLLCIFIFSMLCVTVRLLIRFII